MGIIKPLNFMLYNARKNHVSPGIYHRTFGKSINPRNAQNVIKKIVQRKSSMFGQIHNTNEEEPKEEEKKEEIKEFDVSVTVYTRLPYGNNVGYYLVIEDDAYYYARLYTTGMNGYVSYNYQTKKALDVKYPIIKHVKSTDKLLIKSSEIMTGMHGYGTKPTLDDTIGEGKAEDYSIIVNGKEYPNTNSLIIPIEEESYEITIQYKSGKDTF